jgi:hypothetical protein
LTRFQFDKKFWILEKCSALPSKNKVTDENKLFQSSKADEKICVPMKIQISSSQDCYSTNIIPTCSITGVTLATQWSPSIS